MSYYGVNRKMIRVFYLIVIVYNLLTSCDFLSMNFLTIVSWQPGSTVVADFDSVEFKFEFSVPVNIVSIEKAFTLNQSGNQVIGTFNWNSEKTIFTFIPYENLPDLYPLELRITTVAEDLHGNTLNEEFFSQIWITEDTIRPQIIHLSPSNNSSTDDLRQPITIEFSEPIESVSWFNSFNISPSVSGSHHWSSDKTMYTFIPQENLRKQTEYTVTISQSLQDFAGNSIAEEQKIYFFVGTDNQIPELLSVQNSINTRMLNPYLPGPTINQGWETTDLLTFSFSKAISIQDLRSKISFQPAVQFNFVDNFTLYQETPSISFTNPLINETTYILRIGKGVNDAYDNKTQEDFLYHFRINGEMTKPPTLNFVTGIAFTTDLHGQVPVVLDPDMPFPHSNFPIDSTEKAYFDFLISVADPSDTIAKSHLFIQNFLNSLNISTSNNSAIFDILGGHLSPPSYVNEGSFTDDQPSILPLGERDLIIRVYVDFTPKPNQGLITIEVDSNFEDTKGTPVLQEWKVQYNKE